MYFLHVNNGQQGTEAADEENHYLIQSCCIVNDQQGYYIRKEIDLLKKVLTRNNAE